MRPKIASALSMLFALACACSFFVPNATPTPIVIYRPLKEMNLQPGDAPELEEIQPEKTVPDPVLPEAEGQNRKSYKKGDARIDSFVMVVPEPSARSFDEIYRLFILWLYPNSQKGAEKFVPLGENAALIEFTDACGPGAAVIFFRSNVIVVVFGCGVDADTLLRIAAILDGRVRQNGATVAPPPDSGQNVQPNDSCRSLNLTPEECANAGLHTYLWILTQNTCSEESARETNTWDHLIEFTDNGHFQMSGEGEVLDFVKVGENVYAGKWTDGWVDNSYTVTFTAEGFKFHTLSRHISSGKTCEIEHEAVRR